MDRRDDGRRARGGGRARWISPSPGYRSEPHGEQHEGWYDAGEETWGSDEELEREYGRPPGVDARYDPAEWHTRGPAWRLEQPGAELPLAGVPRGRIARGWSPGRISPGYATSRTRDDDHEMGHGRMMGVRDGPGERRQGRGPRNYRRPDERIREEICEQLMQSWMDSEDVDVQVEQGEVTLTGFVPSREQKRAVEDVSYQALGVKEVHNRLKLRPTGEPRAANEPVRH